MPKCTITRFDDISVGDTELIGSIFDQLMKHFNDDTIVNQLKYRPSTVTINSEYIYDIIMEYPHHSHIDYGLDVIFQDYAEGDGDRVVKVIVKYAVNAVDDISTLMSITDDITDYFVELLLNIQLSFIK